MCVYTTWIEHVGYEKQTSLFSWCFPLRKININENHLSDVDGVLLVNTNSQTCPHAFQLKNKKSDWKITSMLTFMTQLNERALCMSHSLHAIKRALLCMSSVSRTENYPKTFIDWIQRTRHSLQNWNCGNVEAVYVISTKLCWVTTGTKTARNEYRTIVILLFQSSRYKCVDVPFR